MKPRSISIALIFFVIIIGISPSVMQPFLQFFPKSSQNVWSSPQVISVGTSINSWRPEIAADSENNVHIIWGQDDGDRDPNFDGPDQDILYSFGTSSSVTKLTFISFPSDFTYRIGKTGNEISWTLADPTILTPSYALLKDGIELENNTWISYEPISFSVDNLDIGTYNYTLIASDGLGELVDHSVFVTVRERGFNASEFQTLIEIGIGLIVAVGIIGITMTIILLRRSRK